MYVYRAYKGNRRRSPDRCRTQRDYSDDFEKFKRTELVSDIRTERYTFEQAADYAYEKYLENGNLLMILNTKKAACELFRQLKKRCESGENNAEIIHLSTLMCPAHRKDKLELARKLLSENKPVICISTQLIEAGVCDLTSKIQKSDKQNTKNHDKTQ